MPHTTDHAIRSLRNLRRGASGAAGSLGCNIKVLVADWLVGA